MDTRLEAQSLGSHQTLNLANYKPKYLDQNMPKNAYFWEKSCKIAAASAPHPNPPWPPEAGGFASRPPLCNFNLLLQLSLKVLYYFEK